MKQVTVITILLLLTRICWGQANPVSNYWAFSMPMAYGKELVDLEGNPVPRTDTTYFVYIETKQNQTLRILSVSYKGMKWNASVHAVPERNVEVGIRNNTEKKVVISRQARNYLWRVELSPSTHLAKPILLPMQIKGKTGNRSFHLFIQNITLLENEIVG